MVLIGNFVPPRVENIDFPYLNVSNCTEEKFDNIYKLEKQRQYMRKVLFVLAMLVSLAIVAAQENQDSFWINFLPDGMEQEIARIKNPITVDRLSKEASEEEINRLGVKGAVAKINEGDEEMFSAAYEGDKERLSYRKSVVVYRVNNIGKQTYVSKITISVTGNGLKNIEVIEKVPEEYLASAARAIYSEEPEIIEKNPAEFKWSLDYLSPGKTKDYSYLIEAKVEELPNETVVVAYTPGFMVYFARFLYHGGWAILLILLLMVAYFAYKQWKEISQKLEHKRSKAMFKKIAFFRKK